MVIHNCGRGLPRDLPQRGSKALIRGEFDASRYRVQERFALHRGASPLPQKDLYTPAI